MSPVRQPTEYRRSVCLRSLLERVHSARCWMTDILSGESLRAVGAGTKLDRDGSKLDSETEQNWIFEDLLGSDWY